MSQHIKSSLPAPKHQPSTAAIIGLRTALIRFHKPGRGSASPSGAPFGAISAISAPAAKILSPPVTTKARTEASSSPSVKASAIARSKEVVRALRFSGRLRRNSRTPLDGLSISNSRSERLTPVPPQALAKLHSAGRSDRLLRPQSRPATIRAAPRQTLWAHDNGPIGKLTP